MLAIMVIGAALRAAPSWAGPATPEELKAYRAAEARAGSDPEAHVRLALWCEARGLDAERARHLGLAIAAEPGHAAARGLLGQVAHGEGWARPDEVAVRVRADARLAATLDEYDARRGRAPRTQEAQWQLALWCERAGLRAEAQAHFTAVAQLPPRPPRRSATVLGVAVSPDVPADHREAAWRRLGCRKYRGRWRTEAQIRAEQAEARARQEADRAWGPRLAEWRGRLADPRRRDEAEADLAGVTDPGAAPAIGRVFGRGKSGDQLHAVQLFGQIDAPEASRGLALLAISGTTESVRRAATESLRGRDPREYAGPLIGMLHDPLTYDVRPVGGPGRPGELTVEGEQFVLRRRYDAPPVQGGPRYRAEKLREAEVAAVAAGQRLLGDLTWIECYNAAARASGPAIARVLADATGQDPGTGPGAWKAWYVDLLGYSYTPPATKPTYTQTAPSPYRPIRYPSCFGAGTPVRTLTGLRPIEAIRVGDRVLSQDTRTGALGYRPVVAVHHNPPAATLVLRLGGERIVSSTYHRFWRPGRGWAMARELEPGDAVRTLDGPARVLATADGGVQPVYNLDVADDRDFFVGGCGALVHDNSLPEPVREPFDAAPDLAAPALRE